MRFHSKPIDEHVEVPLAEEDQRRLEVVEHRHQPGTESREQRRRRALVQVNEDALDEEIDLLRFTKEKSK